jgi:Cdc6-like AAA superfamily ATPase
MSKAIIIVGSTGEGKTTQVKEILKQTSQQLSIFDVNNEYREFKNNNITQDFNLFLIESKKKINTCIVFEEATIFFSHQSGTEDIKNILVRKRHTKNLLIFNFHSLRQVPLFLLDFCDCLILFRTKDLESNIDKRFKENESILKAFAQLKNAPKYSKRFIFDF